jgi:hypothetical protein
MAVLRIVSVRTGDEVSRAEIAKDGTVTYSGAAARSAVRRQMAATGQSETAAITSLLKDGWSNGYLMVDLRTR